ncbi:MAG: hypothetical protein QXO19_03425 [Candidatus Aenigmatarchaeota archaeon]
MPEEILEIKSQKPSSRDLGLYLYFAPSKVPGDEVVNQYAVLNYTGPPGSGTNLYYTVVFLLNKLGYNVQKVDEWIEISPTHKEYYERVISQKSALEASIKASLIEAARAISDYELIAHDLRKYKEMLSYFEKNDEHMLRALFIDNVDIHTDFSLSKAAVRWPTIISDFQKLSSDDLDVKKIQEKLKVPLAEAHFLKTKLSLYNNWKAIFKNALIERYERLLSLAEARKKTIEEYRKWAKPYISRYKMMKVGYERPGVLRQFFTSFADLTGQATYANKIRIWAFTKIHIPEIRPQALIKKGGFIIDPYDSFVRENFILNKSKGLAKLYPWLLQPRRWCPNCNSFFSVNPSNPEEPSVCPKCNSITVSATRADEIVKDIKDRWVKGEIFGVTPNELYYVMHDIEVDRVGSRLPTGQEIEDITFTIKTITMSQNILLVKLLELECRELELEQYIDELLGIRKGEESITEVMKREFPNLFKEKKEKKLTFFEDIKNLSLEISKKLTKISKTTPAIPSEKLPGKIAFAKPGPYESDFFFRITKHYLSIAGALHSNLVGEIKKNMGIH